MVDLKAAPTADTGAETAASDSPDRLAEADCSITVRRHRRRPNPALAADGLPVPTADALVAACMLSAPPPCWACSLPPCAEESKKIACFPPEDGVIPRRNLRVEDSLLPCKRKRGTCGRFWLMPRVGFYTPIPSRFRILRTCSLCSLVTSGMGLVHLEDATTPRRRQPSLMMGTNSGPTL